METEAPEPAPGVDPLTDEELREAHAHDSALESWKTRTTKDMPHGVFEIDRENLRFICMPDAFPHELHEAMKFDDGWWQCEFDPPVLINLDHLCMLHEEVQRLDLEIFDKGRAGTQTKLKANGEQISTRERNTLLTIIAALCKDAGYDYTKHAKTAGLIQSTAEKMGVSIGETTIEGHLKKIPDALGSRAK